MSIPEQTKVMNQLGRIVDIFTASEGAVRPHFMLTGPSGSGKSHIIDQLAKTKGVGYFEVNAAQLTKEGTAGNSLSKALSGLRSVGGSLTICFVDEFDKLFISGNLNSDLAHEVTNGVQNEFLRVLESSTASVFGEYGKYDTIPVDNVLFVFAGAFNGEPNITIDRLRDFGIKTEFIGRVGLLFNLEKLSVSSMYQALQASKLLDNYLRIFPNVARADAENAVMTVVARVHDQNTLGIRLLNTLINQYFINDGRLNVDEVEQSTFHKTLSFTAN